MATRKMNIDFFKIVKVDESLNKKILNIINESIHNFRNDNNTQFSLQIDNKDNSMLGFLIKYREELPLVEQNGKIDFISLAQNQKLLELSSFLIKDNICAFNRHQYSPAAVSLENIINQSYKIGNYSPIIEFQFILKNDPLSDLDKMESIKAFEIRYATLNDIQDDDPDLKILNDVNKQFKPFISKKAKIDLKITDTQRGKKVTDAFNKKNISDLITKIFKSNKKDAIEKLQLSGIIDGERQLIDFFNNNITFSKTILYNRNKFEPEIIYNTLVESMKWFEENYKTSGITLT
jgi:hypothetical protein